MLGLTNCVHKQRFRADTASRPHRPTPPLWSPSPALPCPALACPAPTPQPCSLGLKVNRHFAHARPKRDVVSHSHVLEQRIALQPWTWKRGGSGITLQAWGCCMAPPASCLQGSPRQPLAHLEDEAQVPKQLTQQQSSSPLARQYVKKLGKHPITAVWPTWKTKPRSRSCTPSCVMSSSSKNTRPEVGSSSPAIRRSSVVLPAGAARRGGGEQGGRERGAKRPAGQAQQLGGGACQASRAGTEADAE